jgi:hypothetical protein
MHVWLDRELKGVRVKPALDIFMGEFKDYENADAMWADIK